jgi:hypothetical protein
MDSKEKKEEEMILQIKKRRQMGGVMNPIHEVLTSYIV